MTNDKPALNELPALLAAELASLGRALSSTSREIICGILDDAVARAEAAEAEVRILRGAIAAQDERNLAATERLDMPPAGCDTSDWLADEVLGLRARVCELEEQSANQTFVIDRLPPAGEMVEVLLLATWEPRVAPAATGRWRDRRYETLTGVQGWRPYRGPG